MDYIVNGLGDEASLLTSRRSLVDLDLGGYPTASHAGPDALLVPGDLVMGLTRLPEHVDGHVHPDPFARDSVELLIWIGGIDYALRPVTCPTCGFDLRGDGFPPAHKIDDGAVCPVTLEAY